MSELDDLYQEVIIDHGRRPRNFGPLEGATHQADGDNPLCGDKVKVYLRVDDHDTISDVRFEGSGCAISTASASLLTQSLKGKTRAEAETLFRHFHDLVTGDAPPSPDLGKLAVFGGVSKYPTRVKCASLAWHTVLAALKDKHETVTTE